MHLARKKASPIVGRKISKSNETKLDEHDACKTFATKENVCDLIGGGGGKHGNTRN